MTETSCFLGLAPWSCRTWTGGRAALNQHLFKVNPGSYPKWFVFRCVESHLRAFRAIAAGKATTMGHIKREHLHEALCVVPDRPLFDAARRVFDPLVDITIRQSILSRELDALRDTLLPKLVSGEVRLPPTLVERYGARLRDGGDLNHRSPHSVPPVTESTVEAAALDWLRDLGYRIVHGPDVPPGPDGLRNSYADAVLPRILRDRLESLNPDLPPEALDDAFRKLTSPQGTTLAGRNRYFHHLLVDGVTVEYRDRDGAVRGASARVVDFEQPANNDWLAVGPVHGRREQE